MCEIADTDTKIQKMGHEFKKVSMPAWKRTIKNGKFIELAREKVSKKKENKRNILHMPLTKKSMKAVLKKDCGGGAIVFKKGWSR